MIYTDGYITDNCFGIAFKSDDVEILNKLKRCMNSTHKIGVYTNNGYGDKYKKTEYARLIIRNQHLVDSLINNGVLYNKSKILKPPNIKHDMIRHFIRGYMDGDGHITKNNASSPFYVVGWVGTKDVLNWIGDYFICEGLTERYKIHSEHGSEYTFSLKFGGNVKSVKNIKSYI